MSVAAIVGCVIGFAAVFIGLGRFLLFDRPADNSSRRYRVHPQVVLRALFAAACVAGATWLAAYFEDLHEPLLAGLALASVVPAMLVVFTTVLAFGLVLFVREPAGASASSAAPANLSPHMKLKGRVRGGLIIGMVTLQFVLMPVYGAQTGFLIALGTAALIFVALNRLYDL